VFISADGQNLMAVSDVAAGTHSLDLSQFSFEPANYLVFVKAVGKPSIVNHMSSGVSYSIANKPPVALLSATPTSGIAPVSVSASTSGSYDADGSIASTTINWGDGSSTSATSGSHNYTTAGNYTITATVTDTLGASTSATKSISVAANQPPTAKLSVTPATGTAPVVVTASTTGSTDVDGTIAATTISWGDGSSTTATSGSHTYSTAGTYSVTATVTDDRGASSTASATATVTAATQLTAGGVKVSSPTPNTTVGSSVHFVATATPSGNSYITAMKVYVDGTAKYSIGTASMNTYVTMSRGSHSVTVKAWDSAGKVFSASMTIRVK
jgi:PKD repeat protein